jgi:hypothetical protein
MYSFGIFPPTTLFSIVMPFAALVRLNLDNDVAVLTAAA